MSDWRVIHGDVLDCLRAMEAGSVQTCVTSPPYWGLRDYGVAGQIGLERTPGEFVAKMVEVFGEVRRVLKDDGTLWLNLGDSYAGNGGGGGNTSETMQKSDAAMAAQKRRQLLGGLKPKDLVGIPWRVALALQADGWYLRQDIIWNKPNPMPESVTDRCTKAHEYIFLLAKSERYYFDQDAIKEAAETGWNGSSFTDERDLAVRPNTGRQPRFGGNKYGDSDDPKHATKSGNEYAPNGMRNRRTVWTVSPAQFSEAHFATFPPKLIEPCILAGCPEGGTVLDPFSGSGTTGLVSIQHQRKYIGIELNPEYVAMSRRRLTAAAAQGKLFGATA